MENLRQPNRRERRRAMFAAKRQPGNNRKTTKGRVNQYIDLGNGKFKRVQHKSN